MNSVLESRNLSRAMIPARASVRRTRSGKPTICHLLHSLNVGGAEVLAARLGRRFAGDHRVIFACLDELGSLGQELREEGYLVHVLSRKPGLDWRCTARLGALLRRERVDVIHAHQYTPFFYALTARLLHRRAAILFLEHGRHQPDYPRPKRMIANRLLLERRDRVVAVGNAVRQALIDYEGIPESRVGVIYNGTSPAAYTVSARAGVRAELGLADDAFVLIQVARLDPIKDHATALRAFAQFAEARPDSRLLLVGDGPERPNIEKLLEQLNLRGKVQLLGTRSDVARLLSCADVFLLTSISEGIPLTLIEAMAAGLPVVATRVGGVSEVVEDGETGFLVESGNADGIAAALSTLAMECARGLRMGQQGRVRSETIFSEREMVSSYGRLYEEMLPVRGRHGS